MYIKSKQPSTRVYVYESQARFLAGCIRRVEDAFRLKFDKPYNPDAGDSDCFWALPEYDVFHDAAYACGFVCNDMNPNFNIDNANRSPDETIGRESFKGLRHYVHTLMRSERNSRMDGYCSPVCFAIESGALGIVARRLESDMTLYENSNSKHKR